jgi:hypothetical protein
LRGEDEQSSALKNRTVITTVHWNFLVKQAIANPIAKLVDLLKEPFFYAIFLCALIVLSYIFVYQVFVVEWQVPPPSIFSLSDASNIGFGYVRAGFSLFLMVGIYYCTLSYLAKCWLLDLSIAKRFWRFSFRFFDL